MINPIQFFTSEEQIFTDRSRITTDWTCPRKRWWNYEWGGRGIAPEGVQLELFLGIVLHDSLAAIAHGIDIDKVAETANTEVFDGILKAGRDEVFAKEQSTLVEGMLRGFYKQVWPRWMKQYRIVAIEKECTLDLGHNLIFMAKPDLILEDIESGELVYMEYKSTSSNKEGWINSWSTAVQLHSSVKAVEATLGKRPTSVVVQGLYKGYESYGKQSSPFCYGYYKQAYPPITPERWSYKYASGYEKYPLWEREGGVKAWVEGMPDDLLANQFPATPPIFLKDDLIEAFFRQRVEREVEVRMARETLLREDTPDDVRQKVLDMSFPQKFDTCAPGWGKGCGYKKLCFSPMGDDPLRAGYVWRDPHHAPEVEAMEAENGTD